MIFVTVGTQLAFPRLVDAMDEAAAGMDEPVVAQVGPSEPGQGDWPHLDARAHLAPDEFDGCFAEARVVVGHAGMGTILSARAHGKPLILLPRRAALGEHRNDHQMATARHFADRPGIHVAWEAGEIAPLLARGGLGAVETAEIPAKAALVARLRAFIG